MTDSYKKIFVSLDGTEMQSEVFARACEIAAASGAELYVGHVIDSTPMQAAGTYPATLIPSLEKAWKDSIEADVESARKLGTIKSITVEAKAADGSPVTARPQVTARVDAVELGADGPRLRLGNFKVTPGAVRSILGPQGDAS